MLFVTLKIWIFLVLFADCTDFIRLSRLLTESNTNVGGCTMDHDNLGQLNVHCRLRYPKLPIHSINFLLQKKIEYLIRWGSLCAKIHYEYSPFVLRLANNKQSPLYLRWKLFNQRSLWSHIFLNIKLFACYIFYFQQGILMCFGIIWNDSNVIYISTIKLFWKLKF